MKTFALLSLLPLFLSGCNIMGFVADKTASGEHTDAHYVLPKEPTIVIAENWKNPTGTAMDAEEVSRFVSANLTANDAAPQIDPALVTDLKTKRTDFHNLTISQIGKLVGAKQVVYINLTGINVIEAEGSESVHGKATARVKVIEVESSTTLWPTDAVEGFPISIQTPMATAHGEAGEAAAREQLLDAAADRISRLFYSSPVE